MTAIIYSIAAAKCPRRAAFLSLFPTLEDFEREHPRTSPSHLDARYPSVSLALTSSSASGRWIAWRDFLSSLMDEYPDNPNFARYLGCANEVLDWRAALNPVFHFWDRD